MSDPLLDKVLVVDKKLDVEETYRPKEIIRKGCVNRSIYKATADSYSSSLITWNNVVPPSPNTVLERSLRVQYQLTITCTGAAGGANYPAFVMQAISDSAYPINTVRAAAVAAGSMLNVGTANVVLRALPLQSSATDITARINGTPTSMSAQHLACLYPHLFQDDEVKQFCTEFPCQKDNNALYAATALNSGNNRSPFAPFECNPEQPSRAAFDVHLTGCTAPVAAAGGNPAVPGVAVYTVTITEQICGVSPFCYGNRMQDVGLSNINNLTLSITIANALRNAISTVPGVAGTVSVELAGRPQLLVEYSSPDPIIAAKMPEQLIYDYELVIPYNSPAGTFNGQAVATAQQATPPALRLSSIPSRFYVYLKPRVNVSSPSTSDTFLNITGLNLTYNNRIGLFSTYTEQDLWKMSVKNGLKDSFFEWKYSTGSIVIIDVASDIGLDADEDAGQSNRYSTCQFTITYNNTPLMYVAAPAPGNDIVYDSYITVVQPGKMLISKSSCETLLMGAPASEVLALSAAPSQKVHQDDVAAATGAGFSRLGKLLHSGLSVAKSALEHIKPEHLDMAKQALKAVGVGGAVAGAGMGRHRRAHQ